MRPHAYTHMHAGPNFISYSIGLKVTLFSHPFHCLYINSINDAGSLTFRVVKQHATNKKVCMLDPAADGIQKSQATDDVFKEHRSFRI
jgi:hypothetical protein